MRRLMPPARLGGVCWGVGANELWRRADDEVGTSYGAVAEFSGGTAVGGSGVLVRASFGRRRLRECCVAPAS